MWLELVCGAGIGLWLSFACYLVLWCYAKRNGLLPEQKHEHLTTGIHDLTMRLEDVEDHDRIMSDALDRLTESKLELSNTLSIIEKRLDIVEAVIDSPSEDDTAEDVESDDGEQTTSIVEDTRSLKDKALDVLDKMRKLGCTDADSEEFLRGYEEWKKETGRL